MGKLLNHRSYLAGPIDRCPNLGVEWRNWISPILRNRWGIIPYNPMMKPLLEPIANEHTDRHLRKQWKENGRLDLLKDFMIPIRHVDLRMTDRSDFGIFYIDIDIHMCGSYEELSSMNRSKKPCLIMCKQGIKHIPDWIISKLPLEFLFGNWDNMFEYINNVDLGVAPDLNRWIFFRE